MYADFYRFGVVMGARCMFVSSKLFVDRFLTFFPVAVSRGVSFYLYAGGRGLNGRSDNVNLLDFGSPREL